MTRIDFISIIRTTAFLPVFLGTLLIFHPLQLIAAIFGYQTHKLVLDKMNWMVLLSLKIGGVKIIVEGLDKLPKDSSLVIVSNHQSMFDIPLIIWNLRDHHPKFIAKQELAKGIPSISLALRTMGAALIDRSNAKSALRTIRDFAKQCHQKSHSICIFPEGTRAKDGILKDFKYAGLKVVLQEMSTAPVALLSISGSWELVKNNLLPLPSGVELKLSVVEVISQSELSKLQESEKVETFRERILANLPASQG